MDDPAKISYQYIFQENGFNYSQAEAGDEPMTRDQIYALPREKVGQFKFDEQVANVFADMIERSVPGYASILSMIEQLTERFATPHSQLFDLGCSLGAATFLMRRQAPKTCRIVAVDNSEPMIRKLRDQIENATSSDAGQVPVCELETRVEDLQHTNIENASLVILNFTLQFIASEERESLLKSICEGTNAGGALLLSEKVQWLDVAQDQLLIDLHHDFKRANGYSDLEIAQKRLSLEKTLIPETIETHCARLKSAGYSIVTPWFQCFNFVSILAIK